MKNYKVEIKKTIKNRYHQDEVVNINLMLEGYNEEEIKNKIFNNIKITNKDEYKIIEL